MDDEESGKSSEGCNENGDNNNSSDVTLFHKNIVAYLRRRA